MGLAELFGQKIYFNNLPSGTLQAIRAIVDVLNRCPSGVKPASLRARMKAKDIGIHALDEAINIMRVTGFMNVKFVVDQQSVGPGGYTEYVVFTLASDPPLPVGNYPDMTDEGKFLELIPESGISARDLTRKTQRFNSDQRSRILGVLLETGKITASGSRPTIYCRRDSSS